MNQPSIDELFEKRLTYPDFEFQERLDRLVGLDDYKLRLSKILGILVNPQNLRDWSGKRHPTATSLVSLVTSRPPLVILAGDVGSGKTELAETIGDMVARQEHIDLTLFPLSLSTRGQGRVGEMTQLISAAFEQTVAQATKLKGQHGKARGAVILLIDEADALAQSREAAQMHHEDRAGVNALIRGINRLSNGGLPAAVIMCTNRLGALDPAVRRRAADILEFRRPNDAQRKSVLKSNLHDVGFTAHDLEMLVAATGPSKSHPYGYTFSDLTQRLLPTMVMDAYPDSSLTAKRALEIARELVPTPPFKEA
jgi:AAA+ superfamily predicted ATPase